MIVPNNDVRQAASGSEGCAACVFLTRVDSDWLLM